MRRALLASAALTALVCAAPGAAPYGKPVKIAERKPLRFADFTLEHTRVYPVRGPVQMVYYEFRATRGKESKTFVWSSGTGDIGPAFFSIGGREYWLEMRYADKIGWLKDGEIVVRRAP